MNEEPTVITYRDRLDLDDCLDGERPVDMGKLACATLNVSLYNSLRILDTSSSLNSKFHMVLPVASTIGESVKKRAAL